MQASAELIWNSAQENLRSMLSADTFNLWFAPLRAASMDASGIVLEVSNDFCEVWLKDNYMDLLQDVIALASQVSRQDLDVFLNDWFYGTTTPAMPGHPEWTVTPVATRITPAARAYCSKSKAASRTSPRTSPCTSPPRIRKCW